MDCFPAVTAALKHTKVIAEDGLEKKKSEANEDTAEDDKDEGKTNTRNAENALQFVEFRRFLQNLRLYFLFCQVDTLDPHPHHNSI